MTTAAERLVQLTGGAGGLTAAQRLRMLGGTAATAGALLVAFSGLPSATAAEHLLAQHQPSPSPTHQVELISGGSGRIVVRDTRPHVDPVIRRNNEAIIAAAIALITQGILE